MELNYAAYMFYVLFYYVRLVAESEYGNQNFQKSAEFLKCLFWPNSRHWKRNSLTMFEKFAYLLIIQRSQLMYAECLVEKLFYK